MSYAFQSHFGYFCSVGAEGFMQTQTNAVVRDRTGQDSTISKGTGDTMSVRPFGISAFAVFELLENNLNFFIRYDLFDPDNNFDGNSLGYPEGCSASKEHFLITGLD